MTIQEFKARTWEEIYKTDYKTFVEFLIVERGKNETLEDYNAITNLLIEEAAMFGLDDPTTVALVVVLGLQNAYEDYCKIVGYNPVKH